MGMQDITPAKTCHYIFKIHVEPVTAHICIEPIKTKLKIVIKLKIEIIKTNLIICGEIEIKFISNVTGPEFIYPCSE